MRGLKPPAARISAARLWVASFTDAWIETGNMTLYHIPLRSHLLQMRGLKPACLLRPFKAFKSHLLQMRGLKQTPINKSRFWIGESHLLQMRGLKQTLLQLTLPHGSRIFYRCVDWNGEEAVAEALIGRRIFYRCVDWNCITIIPFCPTLVASFTDAWIETSYWYIFFHSHSRIFYRCVDWNIVGAATLLLSLVASFTDAWIETSNLCPNELTMDVASFTDAWIETYFW